MLDLHPDPDPRHVPHRNAHGRARGTVRARLRDQTVAGLQAADQTAPRRNRRRAARLVPDVDRVAEAAPVRKSVDVVPNRVQAQRQRRPARRVRVHNLHHRRPLARSDRVAEADAVACDEGGRRHPGVPGTLVVRVQDARLVGRVIAPANEAPRRPNRQIAPARMKNPNGRTVARHLPCRNRHRGAARVLVADVDAVLLTTPRRHLSRRRHPNGSAARTGEPAVVGVDAMTPGRAHRTARRDRDVAARNVAHENPVRVRPAPLGSHGREIQCERAGAPGVAQDHGNRAENLLHRAGVFCQHRSGGADRHVSGPPVHQVNAGLPAGDACKTQVDPVAAAVHVVVADLDAVASGGGDPAGGGD